MDDKSDTTIVNLMNKIIEVMDTQSSIIKSKNNLINKLNAAIDKYQAPEHIVFPNCMDVFLREVLKNILNVNGFKVQDAGYARPKPNDGEQSKIEYKGPSESNPSQAVSHTLDFFYEYFRHTDKFPPRDSTVQRQSKDSTVDKGCCCLLESSLYQLDGTRKYTYSVKTLFLGDLVWLFYMDRMGIFKIITALLDDFKTRGKYALENSDPNSVIMEAMIREINSGNASTARDRNSSYLRCLGWVTDLGRKLNLETQVNQEFGTNFHKFIQHALQYYNARRLAIAIKSTAQSDGTASAATLESIRQIRNSIKNAKEPFEYGRTFYNVLNGIVWVIASIYVVEEIRSKLGITDENKKTGHIMDSAYAVLVENKPPPTLTSNRYTNHLTCAKNARRVLLDLEVLDIDGTNATGRTDLELWLDEMESVIEGYRTAYRNITGVDLGSANINEQVQISSLTV